MFVIVVEVVKNINKTAKTKHTPVGGRPFYKRKAFLWPVGILAGLVILVFVAFKVSPWPGIILIRTVFDHGSRQTSAALEKHKPSAPVKVISDQQYEQGNNRAMLDIYLPESTGQSKPLPVVIWVHGGAWVSGDKANNAPYFKLIASQGFAVVSVNYTLAPQKKYPAQIHELNKAYGYVAANAARFHIDPNMIFLAGDSAGSQLSSQMAALITNSKYADEVGIKMSLQPSQLSGVILFCGIYKMEGLVEANPKLPKILSWGDDEVVWAYSGTRSKSGPLIREMSPYYHVTKDFPATFISGGNADPLTEKQSMPLAEKLKDLQVPVTTLFYPADHKPDLPHEYQFNLDTADGKQALKQVIDFIR